jgi:hypothetical protein
LVIGLLAMKPQPGNANLLIGFESGQPNVIA